MPNAPLPELSPLLQNLINWGFVISMVLTALSTALHAVGLDQNPKLKPILKASNDLVGMFKALVAMRSGGGGGDSGGKPKSASSRGGLGVGALAMCVALVLPGCTKGPLVPQVVAALDEIPLLLQAIRAAETVFFLAKPDPGLQSTIERRIAEVSLASDAALRIAQGAEDIQDGKVADALDKLKTAYSELLAVLRDAHIIGVDGRFAAGAGPGQVHLPPDPLVFGLARR